MRILASVLIFSAVALPCAAQTVLKSEPLVLAPYEIAFVQDASCPARQGAQGHRRDPGPASQEGRAWLLAAEQASLATATP